MKYRLTIVAFCLLAASAIAVSAQVGCPALEKVRGKLHEKPFVVLQFKQVTRSDVFESTDTLTGNLWAGQEGRFRMSTPGQLVVSNGVVLWSYSPENRQVLVDSIETIARWDPLTLLYDPEAVYRCRTERKQEDGFEFDMVALDTLTSPRRFTLQVSDRTFCPEKVSYLDDIGSAIEVIIERFTARDMLPDSLFNFRPGPGVEVIRMP